MSPHSSCLQLDSEGSRPDSIGLSDMKRRYFEEIAESLRNPGQQESSSLFGAKLESMEPKHSLESYSISRESCLTDGAPVNKLKLFMDLPIPVMLEHPKPSETISCLSGFEGSLGLFNKVVVEHSFGLGELLEPEMLEKFKASVTPAKTCAVKDVENASILIVALVEDSDSCLKRPADEREPLVQLESLPKSASSASHVAVKQKMIRGFSVPHCSQQASQSYQDQVKEFQDILSSKARQIAEVENCLRHKEMLYKILQL